jgi:hypothetical protein
MDWHPVDLHPVVVIAIDVSLGCSPIEPVRPVRHEFLQEDAWDAVGAVIILGIVRPPG